MSKLLQYISRNRVFKNLFQDFLEIRAQASKTILRIYCEFFLIYLRIKTSTIGRFRPEKSTD